jgi:predicted esterase
VASLAVKGSVAQPCQVDAAHLLEIAASPGQGFHWPYLLYVPEKPTAGHLLVAPNNTGFETEDLALLRASATCTVREQARVASTLGAPLLVPLFPRPATSEGTGNLYLHALTRAALETQRPDWKRVDLQLLAMVKDAQRRLSERGAPADRRLLLTGFSASGSFVNRFAMLHPKDVLAVAVASPGGWPLAPVATLAGEPLPYPVGLADLEALVGQPPSPEALRQIHWLFLLGADDDNDAVPHRDSFSAADQALVFRRFGKTPVSRWKKAEGLYRDAGLKARFRLYPRTGHEVSAAMQADILRFFQDALLHP